MTVTDVAVFSGISKVLTYSVPEGMPLVKGARVRVPVRNSEKLGVVIRINDGPADGLKSILELCDEKPLIPEEVIELLEWTSMYYHSPIGICIQMAFPPLIRKGLDVQKVKSPYQESRDTFGPPPDYTDEQKAAIRKISGMIAKRQFHVAVLNGITGSGKTEVYMASAVAALSKGMSVIYMVPEIALTPQTVSMINSRVPFESAVFHSGLNPKTRVKEFLKVASGKARFIIGTRSAVYAPVKDLGLIIVDEEHDQSYKQSEGVTYNARDIALMRASRMGAVVILGSATPSLETFERTKKNGHTLIQMNTRIGEAILPEIEVVDMKGRNEVISKELMAAINDTLDRNQQVLLFINRRGFSSAIVCPACSRVLECRRCSRSLTYHKAGDNAVCHYCGYFENAPGICPSCGCVEIKHLGLGTERIVEEVQRLVPNAKMLQMDSDRINSQTRLDNALKAIRDKKVDVIIGTQMISKGHDFPGLTLVGIIHAEQLMYMPDFRASERTFQQVVQVAGRAGRTMAGTKVILQTLIPSHPLIEFMSRHDYLSMMQKECEDRRQNDFPPFSFMARCIFSSQKDGIAEEYSKKTSRTLTRPDVKILGPSPAPIELLRNSHRWNFFLTSKNRNSLHACLDSIEKIKFPSSLKVKIDVDPYDML